MEIRASAPAKVILLGEHAVVYGQPAIAVAINKRANIIIRERKNSNDAVIYVFAYDLGVEGLIYPQESRIEITKGKEDKIFQATLRIIEELCRRYSKNWANAFDLSINSSIPRGAGLGSSAAVSVACTAALSKCLGLSLSNEEISQVAFLAEKVHHGTPSGIDNSVSTYGGAVVFQKQDLSPFPIPSFPLVIGDTGIERETKKLVLGVRERRDNLPLIFDPLIALIGKIVNEAIFLLKLPKLDLKTLGHLFNLNHGLLDALGVNSFDLEQLVWAARRAGALGAKLTGAGGGGSMIALVDNEKQALVSEAIQYLGGKPLNVIVDPEGVKVEMK